MPYILTIGDVIWKGEPEWYTDLAYLREEALGARGPGDELRCHVWITLPDMTVLDATYWFRENRGKVSDDFRWEDGIVCEAPVRPDVEYVPLLVGDRLVMRILRLM